MTLNRLDGLTGLRFFAALWVMIFHFREITPDTTYQLPLIDTWMRVGGLGVDLFFVLSGYILSHVYTDSFSDRVHGSLYKKFILFRIARLYPIHIVTFAFMMLLFAAQSIFGEVAHPERFTFLMIISSLTMTHSWPAGVLSPNMPSWSISAEFFAYLLFPFLCVAINRSKGAAWVLLFAGLGLSLLLAVVSVAAETGIINDGLVHVMAGFTVGMAAYRFQGRILSVIASRWTSTIVLAAIIVWIGLSDWPFGPLGLLFFATLIISLTNPHDLLGKALAAGRMVYLGEISYCIYMVHWPVRVVFRELLERLGILTSLWPPVIITAYSLIAIAGAALMYRWIEVPGRSVIRQAAEGRRAAAVTNRTA